MFPGRRGAGRIFYMQCQMSGLVPQVCLLFGPSAAGGAYIPAFCDIVVMVEGNASMYLGSPRMAEMVIGEKISLEDLGGARMHCSVSGCGDILAPSDEEAIELAKRYLSFMPQSYTERPAAWEPREAEPGRSIEEIVPYDQRKWFDMYELIARVVDAGSFFEIKRLFAQEIITGFARLGGRAVGIVANQRKWFDMYELIARVVDARSFFEIKRLFAQEIITGFARLGGRAVGIVANQPKVKGGVLMVDSSDKAARFISLCNAFNIPLVYLADVPGFMVGTKVERAGIIRHGAKMVFATSQATVPKISVVVRKCYGAGLYAMCGPAFEPDAALSLPQGQVAIMGPEPAVNAVYYNRIMELPEGERAAFVQQKREEYVQDVDIYKLASEMLVDGVIAGSELRGELIKRLGYAESKQLEFPPRRNPVPPV